MSQPQPLQLDVRAPFSRRRCLQLGIAGLGGGAAQAAAEVVVRYPAPQSPLDTRSRDLIDLLDAALRRTVASHGPYRMEPSREALTELRQFAELDADRGLLNVNWATPSPLRRTRARPVDFDARRGLLGLRVSLVEQRLLSELAQVRDLQGLRRFTIGQGVAWPDVEVYQASGLHVSTVTGYENLFRMLLAGRFDLFPRGVGEAFDEFDARRRAMPRLAVDTHLLLAYPYPYQYYFAPSQSALALRVERGLQAMQADGSFNAHLWRHHGAAVARARLGQRRVLRLANPNFSGDGTRALDDTLAYWARPPRR